MLPTIQVVAMNERVGIRLTADDLDRHSLLETATILTLIHYEVEHQMDCDTDDVSAHSLTVDTTHRWLAEMRNALQALRLQSHTLPLDEVHHRLVLAHASAGRLLDSLTENEAAAGV